MWQFCAVVAIAAAASVTAYTPSLQTKKAVADKEFLQKQKVILEIVSHVQQPLLNPKLTEIAENYKIDENKKLYTNEEDAIKFWKLWKDGELMARGEEFSPISMEWKLKKMTYALIDLLIGAKNWETFYKTAVWARQHVNEGMFLYSLSIAMHKRTDTKDLMLPPIYELMPQMFFRSEVMQRAYEARMKATGKDDSKDSIFIDSHFYNWFYPKMMPENRMSYFMEDISLNSWNWEMQTMMDAMMYKWSGDDIDQNPEIEQLKLYYPFTWKFLINRYNMEKISNNLPEIEKLMLNKEMDRFVSHLRLKNGKEIPMRPKGMKINEMFDMEMDEIKNSEGFIKWIFEREGPRGAVAVLKNGKGPILKHINNLKERFLNIIGRVTDPKEEMDLAPGAIKFFETQLRDPLYYKMLLRMTDFIANIAEVSDYDKNDFILPGVKIDSMETDKLITFFEKFDVELNNGLEVKSMEADKKMSIIAHHSRLNYKPFDYRMMIDSQDNKKVEVHVFISPMRDSNGLNMTLKERAPWMMEIDRFNVELKSGKNKIERSSKDFPFFEEEKDSLKMMYKKVDDAIHDKAPFYLDNTMFPHLRYPANLLLPKGKKNGMPLVMLAMITNPKSEEMINKMPLWMGFPFDSRIDFTETELPNTISKDIFIYHKKTDEMFETL